MNGKMLESKAGDSTSFADDARRAGGVKRIKVLITKQELQQLLTKQISAAEVIVGVEKRNGSSSPRSWKPKLESIMEVNE
ncbi:heat shock 22K family protein [Hibiscus syriacus]|uniref:Heat shock 22K family protein n=1 Tax=Hibiscus syriacus TaxID=106335 RepID=A0A6A2XZ01_HIBSY|nr:heat shock 22K family protein [Hibiscus syriacus]